MGNNTCDVDFIHEEDVNEAKRNLSEIDSDHLANKLKLLSDVRRLKIIYILSKTEELCVCDISNAIDATIANTSHHLQVLKRNNIVDSNKRSKMLYYHLSDNNMISLLNMLLGQEAFFL